MITLQESIDIPVPFEKLSAWADNLEKEFVKWSPYHLECDLPDGIRQGARVRFYEIVLGLDYNVSGTLTECVKGKDGFSFTFVSDKKSAKITFKGERTEGGCRFSHTESFGLMKPIIGPILNFLFFKIIYRKKADWDLIRKDMILDNQYLYDILVYGRYPERIPIEMLKKEKKS